MISRGPDDHCRYPLAAFVHILPARRWPGRTAGVRPAKISTLWRVLVLLACACAAPFSAESVSSRPAPVTVVSDIDDTIKDIHLWAFGIRHFLLNASAFFA